MLNTELISREQLIPKVTEFKNFAHRLVQISCTWCDQFEIIYSFDKDYQITNLKLFVPAENPAVESISGVYWNAFIYENEIHDLFGIEVKNMVIDYKGKLYRTKVKWPFGSSGVCHSEVKPKNPL